MELVTGRRGSPHITSQQDRQKHQGIFGDGAYILNTGNMLAPEVQSSNKIHIKDGALMFQGALFTVKVGTYDEVTINNGNQGMKRKDLIVARYTYDSSDNNEAGEWAVIQGTPAADNPVAPEVTSGDIQAGDNVVECPVFVANLDGINVTGIDIIPEVMDTIPDLISKLNGVKSPLYGGQGRQLQSGPVSVKTTESCSMRSSTKLRQSPQIHGGKYVQSPKDIVPKRKLCAQLYVIARQRLGRCCGRPY